MSLYTPLYRLYSCTVVSSALIPGARREECKRINSVYCTCIKRVAKGRVYQPLYKDL